MPGYLIAIIVIAVIVGVFAIVFSLSAKISISYDKEISARIKFLFIDKAFDLDDVLRKLLKIQDKVEAKVENMDTSPNTSASETKVAQENVNKNIQVNEQNANAKFENNNHPITTVIDNPKDTFVDEHNFDNNSSATSSVEDRDNTLQTDVNATKNSQQQKAKPNFIKQIYDKDGILGILILISNLLQSANSAIISLIKGLHIRSLYVKMIIGGNDAAKIAMDYGKICGTYYALKGIIFSTMKVHNYDECIEPDYLAKYSEYGFDLVLSISIGAVVKVGLVAAKTFVVNLIKNK